ncbi:response regulator transcription factor [uncultured Jannaschia sp.]|uniref:response regulator transcription factor n=1 Tax=uncultured Jannaschia sp. TaxID=293347 RepID=UPI00261D4322|nr:response regulator transcription factor [uncultured Jannaschia sp.]
MTRVLVVAGCADRTRATALRLSAAGHNVIPAATATEAVELARVFSYDLILLDLPLADAADAAAVLRRLRQAKVKTPALVLAVNDEPVAKLRAFAEGADHYLVRPVDPAELLARVNAIVRRSRGHAHRVVEAGPLAIDLDAHRVEVAGAPVHLTGKEYALLEVLALRIGATVTRDTILDHLYGGLEEPEPKILDVFVHKLRKRIVAAGGPADIIETDWGRGFKLRVPA